MNNKNAKKIRREVARQYAEQEASMRARVIDAIGEMPLWQRIIVAWRMVDKSPIVSELHLWLCHHVKNAASYMMSKISRPGTI